MKIDSTTSSASTVSAPRNRTPGIQPEASPAAEVHLSELAAQLQSSADPAPFDAARVSEIRQAIAEGRFTINAEAIAGRLITSASELLASRPQP